jgi:cellobiose-specific phosphotransferase system component IIC
MVDRIIFTSSLLFSAKEFIAVWLAFKIAVQWKRWYDKDDLGKARASFHIFLIGASLSLMYGVVGGLLVKWLNQADYMSAIAFPLALIAFNLYGIWYANINITVKSKSNGRNTGGEESQSAGK